MAVGLKVERRAEGGDAAVVTGSVKQTVVGAVKGKPSDPANLRTAPPHKRRETAFTRIRGGVCVWMNASVSNQMARKT